MSDWKPSFSPWRHGGWYVNNIRYPSGACGCVSNNFDDKKWRVVCDDRRTGLNEPGDFTFKTRDEAARAEFELVERLKSGKEQTPREVADAIKPRNAKPIEVEWLYIVRNRFVDALKSRGSVGMNDLNDLDRLGRFKVANECWSICTEDARNALLADSHPHVRSTALLAANSAARGCLF